MTRPLFLLTDFGSRDVFVGVMKAVVFQVSPTIAVIDLAHGIPPGDVMAGMLALEDALPHLPPKCVVCCVVDPGVGTRREAIAVQRGGRLFVGPDNGLLSPVLLGAEVRRLPDAPAEGSATFHGRDVFAPWAARLAVKESEFGKLEEFGGAQVRTLPLPRRLEEGAWELEVLTTDGFGNLTTNLRRGTAAETGKDWVEVPGTDCEIPVAATFGDVPPGALVAYYNSSGRLEVAINRGNAAAVLGLTAGSVLRFHAGDS